MTSQNTNLASELTTRLARHYWMPSPQKKQDYPNFLEFAASGTRLGGSEKGPRPDVFRGEKVPVGRGVELPS